MTANQSLHNWLPKLKNVAVLCVGDVMLDRYVYGDVDRVSPEAPIPVLNVNRRMLAIGGAGKVALITKVGQSNLEERIQGYLDEFEENWPDIEMVQIIDDQSDYDEESGAGGELFGDSVLPPDPGEQADPEVVDDAGAPPSSGGGGVSSGGGTS